MKDDFIQEFRIQSIRDLNEAKAIIENNGSLEHAAWFCEQSFEKTVKYVYAYYKLKIQAQTIDSVYDKLKDKSHMRAAELVINMQREIFAYFWRVVSSGLLTNPSIPMPVQNLIRDMLKDSKISDNGIFESMFDSARDKISNLLGMKGDYNDALRSSTSKNLNNYLQKFDYSKVIQEMLADRGAQFAKLFSYPNHVDFSRFLDPPLYQNQIHFVIKTMALAPWILPYAETSRYPLRECNYQNLRLFRDLESKIKPYFALLINEIDELNKGADECIASMTEFHKWANPEGG